MRHRSAASPRRRETATEPPAAPRGPAPGLPAGARRPAAAGSSVFATGGDGGVARGSGGVARGSGGVAQDAAENGGVRRGQVLNEPGQDASTVLPALEQLAHAVCGQGGWGLGGLTG